MITRRVFQALVILQLLHLGEHLVQMAQIYVLGWPPPAAKGVVSQLDVEKVHFVWNLLVLAAVCWLLHRGVRSGWLVATLAWGAAHTAEHGFLLANAVLTGLEGRPGILGDGGVLAGMGLGIPGVTTWTRPSVHFAWNAGEVVLLVVAWLAFGGWHMRRWSLREAGGRAKVLAPRAAAIGVLLLIPSTATAPIGRITALAPVEIWADGFADLHGIAVDAAGNVFVADRDAQAVIRIVPDGTRTIVARGLARPIGLAFDAAGRLLIAEERAGRVVRLETNGTRAPVISGLKQPRWLAAGIDGTLYVSARRLGRDTDAELEDESTEPQDSTEPEMIVRLTPAGTLSVFADDFKHLQALALADDALYAATRGRRDHTRAEGVVFRIPILADGSAGAILPHGPSGQLEKPIGLARDRLGALYVTAKDLDVLAHPTKRAIGKLHADGQVTAFASNLHDPQGLALGPDGSLYVADGTAGRVVKLSAPAPPTLDAPAFTNASPATVTGTTEAGARVDLFLNDAATPVTVGADATGLFTASLALTANAENTVEAFATTHGGEGLTSAFAEATIVHDGMAPALAFVAPGDGAHVRGAAMVQAQASDAASQVASLTLGVGARSLTTSVSPVPPAATVTGTASWNTVGLADGAYSLTATATDRAGNLTSISRGVIVDNTPPDTFIDSGPSGDTDQTTMTFTFHGADAITPAADLKFAWRLDGGDFTAPGTVGSATFTGLGEGEHSVEVTAIDRAGNADRTPAVRLFRVSLRPAIAAVTPSSGALGTSVTIIGSSFTPGAIQVAFNGALAIVRSATARAITTTVPMEARTGFVTVTTPRGVATSAEPFTVTTSEDFELRMTPTTGSVLQGAATSYALEVVSTGTAPFTGLAMLSIDGLSAGVTATLGGAALTGGQRGSVTLSADASAPLGDVTFTVRATAQTELGTVSRAASATVTVLAGNRTALVGRFTFVDGTPIPGVAITLAGATTTSDAGGNFTLLDPPAGTQMLMIDANRAQAGLPIYAVQVGLAPGQVTQQPTFRITPPPPAERFVPIANATQNQVVVDDRFPGASITLPAGVTITGWDGTPKTKIALERLSPDLLPVPPPPGFTKALYQVFFGTPMGGLPSAPLPVTVPNDQELLPGTQAEIWYYDAAPIPGVPAGWRLAGLGTVSQDGSRVVSNPGVGLERFCGVCGVFCIVRNQGPQGNPNPSGPKGGEPVDLGTGLFLLDKTDLTIPGRIPMVVRRHFNFQDPFGRIAGFELSTGPSWALSVDVVLLEESISLRRLILPGNARFEFARQPDGSFVNTTHPLFSGARLTVSLIGTHELRFKDGTVWRFAAGWIPRGRVFPVTGLGLLVEQRDRNGNVLTIERDAAGAPARITQPGGRALTFGIELVEVNVGRITSVTDPMGRVVRYGYSSTPPRRLETVTDPIGGVTRYTYDASGRLTSIVDPRGVIVVSNEHDSAGRVVRQTQADGGVWTYAYTGPVGAHTLVAVTDPRGNVTTHRMNTGGFATETVDALGQVTSQTLDASGRVTSISDALGRTTTYDYDAAGNIARIVDAAGHSRTFTYEPAFNQMTSRTDELGHTTRFEYDSRGNLTAVADALNDRTMLSYDAFGQLSAITDPLGNTRTFTYDAFGNRVGVANALGEPTQREYDGIGRVTARIDALGVRTSYTYDGLDRIIAILDPAAGMTRVSYDENGNAMTAIDPAGNITTHAYDAMNRLLTRTDAAGRADRFAYDGMSDVVSRIDRNGRQRAYAYDALNRLALATYADGSSTAFSYDAAGRLVAAVDSVGGTITRSYDALDRLEEERSSRGTIAYRYDVAGRRVAMDVPGQTPVEYRYDDASRLVAIIEANQQVIFEYDSAGRRVRTTLPNQVTTDYEYDAASRPTALVHRSSMTVLGDLRYAYDAAGRRVGERGAFARTQLADPVARAVYGPANRQLQLGNLVMTYDDNGNLATLTERAVTTAYTWDARDRLVGVTDGASTHTFVYDALGRRIRRSSDSSVTDYLYDHDDVVQQASDEGATTYLRAPWRDEPFSRNGREFYLIGAPGSVIALTDEQGVTTATYTYEAFGGVQRAGATSNSLDFAARDHDPTDLHSYRARYYSSKLRRFITEDPVGFAGGGPNLYAYADNNPILFNDPEGLDATIWRPGPGRHWADGPRNGNWGGANWSGGLGPPFYGPPAPPRDSGDECYMGHDLCWDQCDKCPGTSARCRIPCNNELVRCLKNLPDDPRQWQRPPRAGTNGDSLAYRNWGIRWFREPVYSTRGQLMK